MARFRQCRARPFAHEVAERFREPPLMRSGIGELPKQLRIFVPRECAEEHPVRQPERPRGARYAELDQPAILRHRPDFFDAVSLGRLEGQKVVTPEAVICLASRDRRNLGRQHEHPQCFTQSRSVKRPFGRQFRHRPVANGRAAMLGQPGHGDAICSGKVQARLLANRFGSLPSHRLDQSSRFDRSRPAVVAAVANDTTHSTKSSATTLYVMA